jgi:hypothetical protein
MKKKEVGDVGTTHRKRKEGHAGVVWKSFGWNTYA